MNKNLIIGLASLFVISTLIYNGFNEKLSTITSCVYTQEKYVNAVFEYETVCNGFDEDGQHYSYSCTDTKKTKISNSFLSITINGKLKQSNFSSDITKISPSGYFYTDNFPDFVDSYEFEEESDFKNYEFINNESFEIHFIDQNREYDFVSENINKYGKCLTDFKEQTLMKTKYFYNISYSVENSI